MKRLLVLLFIIALSFTLWSCTGSSCTEHVDSDGNLLCDECGAAVPCENHVDTKTDGTYKCDKCGASMQCPGHVDEDENLKCDECGATVECKTHVDENKDDYCDKCDEFIPCDKHVDKNSNYKCDRCSEDIDCDEHSDGDEDNFCDLCESELACTSHKDADGNLKCDKCDVAVPCTKHVDADRNLKCDKCKADVACTHIDENEDGICDVKGCEWDYDHEHTYASEWSSDETKHWHAVTCQHKIPVDEEAPHSDEDNNGICDVCNYAMCEHLESEEEGWCQGDDDGHWRPLKCGHNAKPDAERIFPHVFNADGICECGYKDTHVHTFEDTWSTTESEHFHKSNCGHDSVEADRAPHVDSKEEYDGICDECGYVMCAHEYYEEWYHDQTNHWHAPKCDHVQIKDVGEHADADNDGICDGCSWNYDHEHPFHWIIEDDGHTKVIDCTHTVTEGLDKEAHVDADNDRLCDVCKHSYNHTHDFAEEWTTDENYHWHICTDSECAAQYTGAKDNYGAHTDANGDFKCDVCNKAYSEKAPEINEDDAIETPKFEVTPSNP